MVHILKAMNIRTKVRDVRNLPAQRAENGGLDPSWLIFAFLGRPDFQSRGPKLLILKGFGAFGRKIGAPQKRENQQRWIQPPILGPLNIYGDALTKWVTLRLKPFEPKLHKSKRILCEA